jgi:hypothetical protein
MLLGSDKITWKLSNFGVTKWSVITTKRTEKIPVHTIRAGVVHEPRTFAADKKSNPGNNNLVKAHNRKTTKQNRPSTVSLTPLTLFLPIEQASPSGRGGCICLLAAPLATRIAPVSPTRSTDNPLGFTRNRVKTAYNCQINSRSSFVKPLRSRPLRRDVDQDAGLHFTIVESSQQETAGLKATGTRPQKHVLSTTSSTTSF